MNKQKMVTQEDQMGCAIACVAYITGKTYKESISLFDLPEKRFKKGYTVREIVEALTKAGYAHRSIYVGRLKTLKIETRAIVYVKKCSNFPFGHYLVKVKDGYMDPWFNLKKIPVIEKAEAGGRKRIHGKMVLVIKKL
jgi:ABC-type bacteriocin/lantibiotic exporter with double-glycine peptidase domain